VQHLTEVVVAVNALEHGRILRIRHEVADLVEDLSHLVSQLPDRRRRRDRPPQPGAEGVGQGQQVGRRGWHDRQHRGEGVVDLRRGRAKLLRLGGERFPGRRGPTGGPPSILAALEKLAGVREVAVQGPRPGRVRPRSLDPADGTRNPFAAAGREGGRDDDVRVLTRPQDPKELDDDGSQGVGCVDDD
jgi:hypothetical protein